MNGTVLVTGAGGFVGSAVVRLLVRSMKATPPGFADGAPVTHLVALLRPGGSRERLEELPESAEWSIEYADITNRAALRDLLDRIRPRAILHLAVDKAAYQELPETEKYRVHIAPLEALFEGLVGVPGARLIHTSSAWILPPGDRLDESVHLQPWSAYTENKAQADRALPILHQRTGVEWINLRLFNIFGQYEKASRLLPYLVSHLRQGQVAELSHGDQIRDFNDVEDIARAYLQALQADDRACGLVYHIGSGRSTRVRDFALAVAGMVGNANLIRFGARETPDRDLPCLVADPTRAQRILHWCPAHDLEAGIQGAVKWWLERTS
jgi:nucleoside-diphosphate-sugar epimerase